MNISKTRALELLNNAGGRIFTATFTTKSGDTRVMNCRRGVTKGVKGTGKYKPLASLGYMTVYDMQSKGFKTVNLQTLSGLSINKCTYKVR